MDMSKHPNPETDTTAASEHTDRSNPGELGAFVLALVLIAALGGGFALGGVAGLTMVMVALVPLIYVVLVTISVGR